MTKRDGAIGGFQHSLVNLWVSYFLEDSNSDGLADVSAFSGESLGELPYIELG